jgi:hypothetical protein
MSLLLIAVFLVSAQDPRPAAWDTQTGSSEPLESVEAQKGWTAAAIGERIQGDAVLSNGRIALVARRAASVLELYGVRPDGSAAPRARVGLDGAGRLTALSLTQADKAAVCLEATYGEATARFRLKRGDVALEVEPGTKAETLRVEAPSKFVVLPDFFADDIVIDARGIKAATAELPSDNIVLHPLEGNDSIAAVVFENREQEAVATVAGDGERRAFTGSLVQFGQKRKIWIALMEGERLWHARDVSAQEAGKKIKLDWTMPFRAQWHCDFTREDGLTDTWDLLLPKTRGNGYLKPSWLESEQDEVKADRTRWTTVLGRFFYPCWIESDGRAFLQPIKHKALKFVGPAVIYPIHRVEETPAAVFTVVDVMRNTLGVGPCEYILDVESQGSQYQGRATCSVRDTLVPIYSEGRQKERAQKIEKTLDEGLTFVKHIRSRIERYVDFGRKTREYLSAQVGVRPELQEPVAELQKIVDEIDARTAARADKIKTPEHVAAMNEEFRKHVLGYEGRDALDRCKAYAKALVTIGDNQDELSGELRWVVKAIRQKAGLLAATDPRMASIAAEIRVRTQEVLKNPASHEGARH